MYLDPRQSWILDPVFFVSGTWIPVEKGIPDFRLQVHELIGFSLVEVNERVGNLSFRSLKGSKRADRCTLSDCEKVECSGFVIYSLVKRDERF